ncbi:MAG: bifunctional (p)ppGpp synthetase/guanosine-3',5'-bis(diphosphate) 3'-pyrophosphohydrolase, partial [Bdellovibrionota bacterium]
MLRFNDLVERVQDYNPKADVLTLQKAYIFSAQVHAGQTRKSGDPYLIHPLEVAGLLAQMRLDVPTIATGLLHDTVEDTLATMDQIEGLFGPEITSLVDGVTKIAKVQFQSKEERQAENFRKMLLATTKDIRVLLIKLADRLHNMRTIGSLPSPKQERIAEETRAIYAPLANRLGLQWIKTELEDLAFRAMKPEACKEIEQLVTAKQKERQKTVDEVCETVRSRLSQQNILATVYGRPKHYASIYKKMTEKSLPFEEIYDVIAFRIVVGSVRECYETLGIVHSMWKPVPGKVKDYIALPKPNMYQSLHTSVIGPYGQPMEFQIRTHDMHQVAEYGIATHWKYKEGKLDTSASDTVFSALRQTLAEHQQLKDPSEFLEALQVDLFPEEVYVFTPRGDVKVLPKGATPIDFAYAVHTDVGHTCIGAKVNGKIVPLSYELQNGDIIGIITRPDQSPSRDWLKWVKTARARQKIREHSRAAERDRSLALGREILEKDLRRFGIELERVAKKGDLDRV